MKRLLGTFRYIDNDIESVTRRVRMAATLCRITFWGVLDRTVSAWRNMPRARQITTAAVVVAVITPTVLFVQERVRRGSLARAYADLTTTSVAELTTLRHTMGNLLAEQAEIRHLLLDAGYAVYSNNELAVALTATGYSSTVIETDDTPFITASNTPTRSGIIALSRDMLRRYNPDAPFAFGDVVRISGLGDFVVEDSMNPRWRRRVDVWFPSRTAAFQFGRQRVILKARVDGDKIATSWEYSLPENLARGGGASAP